MYKSTDKISILFFGGHMTPLKRYVSYFPGFELCPIDSNSHLSYNILTHSIGLVNALIYLSQQTIATGALVNIVAMDPPDLSGENIRDKISNGDEVISSIYQRFQNINLDFENLNVVVFRNIKKKEYTDVWMYSDVRYYDQDTHHPYRIKSVRDSIITLLR